MNVIRITRTDEPLFAPLRELYSRAFPKFEQRTFEHQAKGLTADNYFLYAYQEDGAFIGFVAYWSFDDYIYIEHYAISDEVRGKGYGSRLLSDLLSKTEKTVILEIDPVVDEVSTKRLSFYRGLGFVENNYSHVHPPYRSEFEGHALKVLSHGRALAPEEYQRFYQDLSCVVMAK